MKNLINKVKQIQLPFFVLPLIIGVAAGYETAKYVYKTFKD